MKIALVHDYLASCGGAEQVLAALHELYPEAPIYAFFSSGPRAATEAKVCQSQNYPKLVW